MRQFIYSLFLILAAVGYCEPVSKTIENAREIEEEERYEYFSEKVKQLSKEALTKSPELPFIKSLIAFHEGFFINRRGVILQEVTQEIYDGFAFAVKHAKTPSLLLAAKTYEEIVQIILQEGHLGLSAVLSSLEDYKERVLKVWSSNPALCGDALRWDLFNRWEQELSQREDLRQLLLIFSAEYELILGSIKPDLVSLEGVEEGILKCKIQYREGLAKCTVHYDL